jgi:hypothetical protein
VDVSQRGYAEDPSLDAKVCECLRVAAAFEQATAGTFDILHNHFDFIPGTPARSAFFGSASTSWTSTSPLLRRRLARPVLHQLSYSATSTTWQQVATSTRYCVPGQGIPAGELWTLPPPLTMTLRTGARHTEAARNETNVSGTRSMVLQLKICWPPSAC